MTELWGQHEAGVVGEKPKWGRIAMGSEKGRSRTTRDLMGTNHDGNSPCRTWSRGQAAGLN